MQGLLSNELLSKSSIFSNSGGSNIKSIQRGMSVVSSANTNITISQIDVSKSIIIITFSPTYAETVNQECVRASIIDATTINLNLQSINHNINVSWQVIEFNNVKSKQTGNVLITTSSTDVIISSINPLKSILVFSNDSQYGSDSYLFNALVSGSISNNTTINFKQSMSGSNPSKNIAWQVIEFN